MLPDSNLCGRTIDEFNRLMDVEYECIRDFNVLHYCASSREDSRFWRLWQQMESPRSLNNKLRIFQSQGRLYKNDMDLFAPDSWYAVLEGMSVRPTGFDPRVQAIALKDLNVSLDQGAEALAQTAGRVPDHSEYISRFVK